MDEPRPRSRCRSHAAAAVTGLDPEREAPGPRRAARTQNARPSGASHAEPAGVQDPGPRHIKEQPREREAEDAARQGSNVRAAPTGGPALMRTGGTPAALRGAPACRSAPPRIFERARCRRHRRNTFQRTGSSSSTPSAPGSTRAGSSARAAVRVAPRPCQRPRRRPFARRSAPGRGSAGRTNTSWLTRHDTGLPAGRRPDRPRIPNHSGFPGLIAILCRTGSRRALERRAHQVVAPHADAAGRHAPRPVAQRGAERRGHAQVVGHDAEVHDPRAGERARAER